MQNSGMTGTFEIITTENPTKDTTVNSTVVESPQKLQTAVSDEPMPEAVVEEAQEEQEESEFQRHAMRRLSDILEAFPTIDIDCIEQPVKQV